LQKKTTAHLHGLLFSSALHANDSKPFMPRKPLYNELGLMVASQREHSRPQMWCSRYMLQTISPEAHCQVERGINGT